MVYLLKGFKNWMIDKEEERKNRCTMIQDFGKVPCVITLSWIDSSIDFSIPYDSGIDSESIREIANFCRAWVQPRCP